MDPLISAALAWRDEDPDADTVARLDELVTAAEAGDAAARTELESAFAGPLEFGTAGLRGALGPGPARMNRVVVTRAAAGFGRWLIAAGHEGGKVVVGYDARYKSTDFARDTAEVLAAQGFVPLLLERSTPTPVVAFGIQHYGCVAGIVVTASHNPPQDNGYKVYLGDGSQIVPPTDSEIAAQIAEVAKSPLSDVARSDAYTMLGDDLVQAYVAHAATLVPAGLDVSWAYTAMHGVGARVMEAVAAAVGLPAPAVVAAQHDPDPAFPTVAFPNPEEPGAIDLALAVAREHDVDVVVANDPDADRCAAAAVIDGHLADAHRRRARHGARRRRAAPRRRRRLRQLDRVVVAPAEARGGPRAAVPADAHRLQVDRPRTGPGVRLRGGDRLLLRPEGGARQGRHHRRADAAGAGRVAEGTRADARGPARRDRPHVRAVHDGTAVGTGLRPVPDQRRDGASAGEPARPSLLGEPLTVTDLLHGGDLPPTDGVRLEGETLRVVVRPSGTEPKLKAYLEVRATPEASQDVAAARTAAADRIARLRAEMSTALGLS